MTLFLRYYPALSADDFITIHCVRRPSDVMKRLLESQPDAQRNTEALGFQVGRDNRPNNAEDGCAQKLPHARDSHNYFSRPFYFKTQFGL